MNGAFPPLTLTQPQVAQRRPEKPRPVPVSPEILQRRLEIARRLRAQVDPLSDRFRSLSDSERRAVFIKLEHDGPLPLTGTGLRPISEPKTERFTLAVPRRDNLDALVAKLEDFATAVPERGAIPNAALGQIQSITLGSPTDRLSPNLRDRYESLIKEPWITCEIEIISLALGTKKPVVELMTARDDLMKAFQSGVHGNFFEHEQIKNTIRAVIRCTGELFRRLVEADEWQTRITWFEERPTFETFRESSEGFSIRDLVEFVSPPADAPTVCVIDTGVTAGNPFLSPVVRNENLRSFLTKDPDNPSDMYGHGSGVASLVAYYALNIAPQGTNEAKVWIAGARVLDAENKLEDERLFSMLIRQAVEHFVPLGIRIFNLSVNDLNLGWNQTAKITLPRRSWTARAIDQISKQMDIVFVVSTGNLLTVDVNTYLRDGKAYPVYLTDDDACIHDPGQAALAITVGSIVPSTLVSGPHGRARALADLHQVSPFTRCGPGIRNEVKPEVVEYGGNFLLQEELGRVQANPGLNISVASHQLTPAITYNTGTSFAAARVSYRMARILHDLQEIGVEPSASLLKAFLVNSAKYPLSDESIEAFNDELATGNGKTWLNLFGYGVPDEQRATDCDAFSAVMFYQGAIQPDTVAFFDVPVPENLAEADRGKKRLVLTVVHAPDVQRWGLEEYFGTVLKWRMFRGDVPREHILTTMSRAEDEDLQVASDSASSAPISEEDTEEEDGPKELQFSLGVTLRSRGTVQHDKCEWTVHKTGYSTGPYTLAIAAYERWGRTKPNPIPFAVVVRLEEETRSADVYARVRASLEVLQARAGVRA